MSLFGTPTTDATLEARVAQLEALVATLTGTVDDNAGASQDAVDAVAGDRAAGDAAGLAAVNEAMAASERRAVLIETALGTEVQLRAAQGNYLASQVGAIADQVNGQLGAVEAFALRAELADESIQAGADAADTIQAGRDAVATGALFRVFGTGPRIDLYRKTGSATQELRFSMKSSTVVDAERDAGDLTAKRTSRPSPPIAQGWMQPFILGPDGPIDYFDLVHLRRRFVGVPQPVPTLAEGWRKPLLLAEDPDRDDPVMWHDRSRDMIGFPRPVLEPKTELAAYGGFATRRQLDGVPLAGIYWGRHYHFADRRLTGPVIMGDDNGVPQLFDIVEGGQSDTVAQRQLTFSQKGIAGFEVVTMPSDTAHGLIRIMTRDANAITGRHRARYAMWARAVPFVPAIPTKMLLFVKLGQSLSVGAGSYDNNPSGVGGPQTVLPQQSFRYGTWTHRNLCFNGGTIPHQGDLNGLHIDPTHGYAYNVPIDPARIASFVPMVEGLGQAGAHEDGGWRRESTLSAMAAQLNAPHNFNGSVYIAAGSFGFGSTPFETLLWDGAALRQSALNALAAITQAKALCNAAGIALEVHCILNHGQANQSTAIATYKMWLADWWTAWKAAVQAITGQAGAQQLWIDQNTAARGTFAEPAYSALAQAEFVAEQADVHFLCPNYFTDFETDTVHQKASEYQWSGEHDGEIIADWLIRGEDAIPMMTAATWSGSQLRQVFSHRVMIDPVNVLLGSSALGAGHANLNGATRSISSARIDPADGHALLLRMSSAIPDDAVEVARQAWGNQTTPSPPSQGWGGGPSGGGQRSMIRRADWGERFGVVSGRPLFARVPIQQINATKE